MTRPPGPYIDPPHRFTADRGRRRDRGHGSDGDADVAVHTTGWSPPVDTLRVSEVFGPTIQGEGPAAGRSAVFVRLMGCNLSCAWCDTPYTWDTDGVDLRAETSLRTAHDLFADVRARARVGDIVVITGGEPLLQQRARAFADLVGMLDAIGLSVHIETNGTILPIPPVMHHASVIVMSPKLSNAGDHRGHQDPAVAPGWAPLADVFRGADLRVDVHMKFVCGSADDVDRAVECATAMRWHRSRVWVMPEGRTADELAATFPVIATRAAHHGINVSHRLHVLAWGDRRGV